MPTGRSCLYLSAARQSGSRYQFLLTKAATFLIMSRLFLPNRVCAKCVARTAHGFPVFPLRDGARVRQQWSDKLSVFVQQQRRYASGSNSAFSKYRIKSRVWVCGVGVGIALAVGLKYRADTTNNLCDDKVADAQRTGRYSAAIKVSRDLVERIKVGTEAEVGAPGLVVGVSVDGAQVWTEGIGYADLENRVPCGPETVMRIASISKPLTSAAAARLCEEGKLDLDVPVQKYVPEFPQKQFDGQDVIITPRLILSHLSGIRHYERDAKKVKEDKEKAKRLLKPPVKENENEKSSSENEKPTTERSSKGKEATQKKKEFEHDEYYLKDKFESVIQALDLFKDDPLIFKPGTTFLYSTHAFTLLSAVVERAAGQRFLDVMTNMFRELGMFNTVPDENDPIIYHRSRFYHLNKRGRVVNCPYVDNSYKWAGGGFLSNVGDLLLFGNAVLYGYQVAHLKDTEGLLPGFLKPQTAIELWTPSKTEASWDKDGVYAQGWLVVEKMQKYGQCRKLRHYVSHTGGSVGASSVLLVLPSEEIDQCQGQTPLLPQGVVVSIITNMQSVGLSSTALKIAREFDKARSL
ncbi:serine beta-lactamase-like protein LACTB, mitochondrial isoform X2 [Mastacembelus armatus]|uniref:serine beta-lactamase-like protein LACTB, mitochondrial isoform X2 n=1 Tax=Mastacembelus armatus TaxID=205130 RepID=UPI000E45CCA7|nr:serine beta-lactamase-like protein LACTB, mitochondrial isoform X2 [Mastacembelus armatus]